MAGPDRMTGVGIEGCPALAPEGRRACGVSRLARNRVSSLARNRVSRLARNRVSSLARNRVSRLARNRVSRLVGKGGMTLVGIGGRPIGRPALYRAAARLIAVGVGRVSVL